MQVHNLSAFALLLGKGSRTYHERKSMFWWGIPPSTCNLQAKKKSIRHQHFIQSFTYFCLFDEVASFFPLRREFIHFFFVNCVRENFKISRLFPRLSLAWRSHFFLGQHGNMLKFKNNSSLCFFWFLHVVLCLVLQFIREESLFFCEFTDGRHLCHVAIPRKCFAVSPAGHEKLISHKSSGAGQRRNSEKSFEFNSFSAFQELQNF